MATDDDKVFDVAKPGASGPSSTSKPVIVGHKNMIEDPMVKAAASATLDGVPEDDDAAKAKKESGSSVGPHQGKQIMPLNEPAKEETPAAPEPEKPVEPPVEPKPAVAEPTPETPPAPAADKPDGAADSVPETEGAKPAEKKNQPNEEEQAKEAAIQHLIETKQYVVHVGEAHHRKLNKTIVIIAAAVVLLLAAFTTYLLK